MSGRLGKKSISNVRIIIAKRQWGWNLRVRIGGIRKRLIESAIRWRKEAYAIIRNGWWRFNRIIRKWIIIAKRQGGWNLRGRKGGLRKRLKEWAIGWRKEAYTIIRKGCWRFNRIIRKWIINAIIRITWSKYSELFNWFSNYGNTHAPLDKIERCKRYEIN